MRLNCGHLALFLQASYRVVASIRASRKESIFQLIALCSFQLLVPLGQAQWKPKTTRRGAQHQRSTRNKGFGPHCDTTSICQNIVDCLSFRFPLGLPQRDHNWTATTSEAPFSRSPLGLPLIVLHILSSKKNSAFVGPWPKRVPREGQIMESLQSNP